MSARTTLAVLVLGSALWAAAAEAAGDKEGKGKGKGGAAAASGKKAEVQPITAAGPTLKYEQFRRQVEIKVAEKREAQIDGIKKLLDLNPPENEIPDIKFRLAELYYEKSQFFFFRAQEADDQAAKAQNPGAKDLAEQEKKKQNAESQAWVKSALDLYKQIREKYPKYARMPEVLFALGQSHWNAGHLDDAIDAYRELIKKYKDNPLVADAWLAFGEYYFNKAELNKALASYEHAAADKRSRVYGFALYKQAWCYYNLGDWGKSLEKFRATIFYSQMSEELSGENRISLGREAQKDFVKTYAHQGDANKAKFVFADLLNADDCKTPDCMKLLEHLADLWYSAGNFDESAIVYRQLIVANGESTRNPYYQSRIVDLVGRSGDKKRVVEESRRLIDVWEQAKLAASRVTGEGAAKAKADIDEAGTLAESTLRKLAQVWNREAIKTRQRQTYEFARTMYADYLKLFPDSKFGYEMRFQLGDLYYKLEQFDEAAKAYEATVLADPKGKYVIEAANDNVLAVEEHLKDLRLPKPAGGEKSVDIHPERRRLIDACDRYVKFVPPEKADKLVKIKFKAAKIFYDHNQFEEAIKRFEDIVTTNPEDDAAEVSANLIADTYNLKKDWKSLYEAAARYLKNEPLMKDREKLKKEMLKDGEYAKFKLVQILEERLKKDGGDLRPVAQAYEEFQGEFPGSENADKALFNASVAWDSVGEKERADGLRNKLMKDYKDSSLRAEVQFYIARSFEERAEYEKAAGLFVAFAEKYPNDARSRDALFNAGVFLAGTGKVEKATKLREDYLKKYGTTAGGEKESASIYYSIARDLERGERWSEAAKRYSEFAHKFSNDERVFDALWNEIQIRKTHLRQQKDAEKLEGILLYTFQSRTAKGTPVPPKAADYASRIAFERVDENLTKYKGVRIQRPNLHNPKAFQLSLEEKARSRDMMIREYTGIVTKYKQANSTIASLYRIAESWDLFVEALIGVGCPAGLNEEQCGFFRQGMEEKIAPARQSAQQAYQTCVAKSNELNVFTEYSTKAVKALEKISPDAFPPLAERTVEYIQPKGSLKVRSNTLILKPDSRGQKDEIASKKKGEP
jgi:tetratricopeptide (TPR) repeat protein